MKRYVLVACALAAVLAFPLRALAQPAHAADSPKATLVVHEPLVVGPTILKPGEYNFQCRTFEGRTFLVVTLPDTGKEIVRVPCVREMLDAKVENSQYVTTTARLDGKTSLVSVSIKGEAVTHRLLTD